MMSKQQISEGAKLKYVGGHFEGFNHTDPYVVFLGYDSNGGSNIWVNYRGEVKFMSVSDVEFDD